MRLLIIVLCTLSLLGTSLHAQVPQLINHQGRVVVGTTNFNGNGQFRFALVDAAGTTVYWRNAPDTTPADGVPDSPVLLTVTKGLYSVLLGDTSVPNMAALPLGVFNNTDVRLRVWFNDGVIGTQLLTPDQRITAVGYAMAATTATTVSGNVPASQITGSLPASQLAGGTVSSVMNFSQGLTTTNNGQGNGGQALYAAGSLYGIVATANMGTSTATSVAVSGDSNTGTGVSGRSRDGTGVKGFSRDGYGVEGLSTISNGVVGLSGTTTRSLPVLPYAPYDFVGVYGESVTSTQGEDGDYAYGVIGVATGFRGYGIYGKGNTYAGYFDGLVYVSGNLSVTGNASVASLTATGNASVASLTATGNASVASLTATGNASVASLTATGNASVASLTATGNASVASLTITGGADLAEPFPISAGKQEEELAGGSVVVIDTDNPGHLKRSARAYDTRVAGIVSGAGGVNPGIQLKQEGVMEGSQNVALTGRVYVLADATEAPIKPGDLLTTSDTPGHAMKVSDHDRAQGAIIGKAMSALRDGTGMVLVLVTLQ